MLFAVVLCLTGFVGVASGGSHQSQHALHLGGWRAPNGWGGEGPQPNIHKLGTM